MKLFLTKDEKKLMGIDGKISIERKCYLPAAASSIQYGIGNKSMFDKIAYKWVYGDTDKYINDLKNEGVRGTDYIHGIDGMRNLWNGNAWFEFNTIINEFTECGKEIKSGKLTYQIDDFTVSLRPKENSKYFDVILSLNVSSK